MRTPIRVTAFAATLLFAGGLFVSQTSFAQSSESTKVFWMVTMEVPMSQLPAYHKLNQEKIFPLHARCGYKWVAAWQTIVGDIEEVVGVAEFASMDDYLAARKKLLASAEWAAVAPQLDTMSRGIRTRLLRATSYSLIQ